MGYIVSSGLQRHVVRLWPFLIIERIVDAAPMSRGSSSLASFGIVGTVWWAALLLVGWSWPRSSWTMWGFRFAMMTSVIHDNDQYRRRVPPETVPTVRQP